MKVWKRIRLVIWYVVGKVVAGIVYPLNLLKGFADKKVVDLSA